LWRTVARANFAVNADRGRAAEPDFHWARSGDYVTQVTAIGPLGLEYKDAHDDPRQQRKS